MKPLMSYSITKEFCIHHEEDGRFYQFTDDGEGCIEVSAYENKGTERTKTGQSFHIPKDCISHFILILNELQK